MSVPALPAQSPDLAMLLQRAMASRWLPVAATLLALALLAHSLAQWTWWFITPNSTVPVSAPTSTSTEPDSGAALRDLMAANLFGVAEPGSLSPNQIPETSLNLKLTGVMVRGKGSFALIRVDGKDEVPVIMGGEVQPGTRLHAVYPDKVILARAGVYESLTLKDAAPGLAAGSIVTSSPASSTSRSPLVRREGNRFTVNRETLAKTMQTPEFLTQAMIVPNAGGGFLVREVQPDGIYAKLGVRVGDVIRGINGHPVNTMDDVMKVYQQLGGVNQAGAVSIDVTRGGSNKTLQYNIE